MQVEDDGCICYFFARLLVARFLPATVLPAAFPLARFFTARTPDRCAAASAVARPERQLVGIVVEPLGHRR